MKRIAAYGSLRKGFHNHRWLGEQANLLEYTTVKGAMLLRSGSYPLLFKPEEAPENTTIQEHKIEIYEVDEKLFNRISTIEYASGYKAETFEHPDETITDAIIFWADPQRAKVDQFDKPIDAYTTDIYKTKRDFNRIQDEDKDNN